MRKLSLVSLLALSACMVGPDYQAPSLSLPERWLMGDAVPQATKPDAKKLLAWWEQFNDPTLTALVQEGLLANGDLAVAAARVAEARGILVVAEADLYPTLSAQGGYTRTSRSSEARFGGFATPSKPFNDFSMSGVLSYEVDLWGRLRRATESAQAQLLAEQANRDAVALAVASDIATGYFNLLALDSQISITQQTIAARESGYSYQQKQFNAGQIDVLTARRAEAELAIAQAALPQLEQLRIEQQNALAVLLGRAPKALIEMPVRSTKAVAALPVPPQMPLDAPSTLLERRPDIASAEQQLIASNAQIGVAKADYYPNISLQALLGLASSQMDRFLRSSARTWQAGATTSVPLVDFGRVASNVEAAKAREAQAMANYQQVVRRAFGEVADALARVQTSEARVAAQARQVRANTESNRIANLRFDAGYATQLDQLDAQRQLFQAQLDLVSAQQQRLAASVTLYKALGGGWEKPASDSARTVTPPTKKKRRVPAKKPLA